MSITLKIGNTSIGLIGIEGALSRLRKKAETKQISPEEAALELLAAVKQRNYVPPAAEHKYLQALEKYWIRHFSESQEQESDNRQIRILGPGCVSCNRLEEMVISIFSEYGLPADIEHVKDLDEIWRYGVIQTPALIIGNKVLCSGRLPTRAAVEAWLRELMLMSKESSSKNLT